jgi:hypothetical protein
VALTGAQLRYDGWSQAYAPPLVIPDAEETVQYLLPPLDGMRRARHLPTRDGEETPLAIDLGRTPVREPLGAAPQDAPPDEHVQPRAARGYLRVRIELFHDLPRPLLDLAGIGVVALVEVDAAEWVVLREDETHAV